MPFFEITIRYCGEATYTVEATDADNAAEVVWDKYDHADLNGGSDIESIEEIKELA